MTMVVLLSLFSAAVSALALPFVGAFKGLELLGDLAIDALGNFFGSLF